MEVLKCPECAAQNIERIFQHETPVVARRALSNHRFRQHGVRTAGAIAEAERKAKLEAKTEATPAGSPASVTPSADKLMELLGPEPPIGDPARPSWVRKRWRIEHPDTVLAQRRRAYALKKAAREAKEQRAALQQSSWWKSEADSQGIPIRLSECPICGATFRALKK